MEFLQAFTLLPFFLLIFYIDASYPKLLINVKFIEDSADKSAASLLISLENVFVSTLVSILIGLVQWIVKGNPLLYLVVFPMMILMSSVLRFFDERDFRYSDLSWSGIKECIRMRYRIISRGKSKAGEPAGRAIGDFIDEKRSEN